MIFNIKIPFDAPENRSLIRVRGHRSMPAKAHRGGAILARLRVDRAPRGKEPHMILVMA
jgi:hypothetical protein